MTTNYVAAIDEMYAIARAAWIANSTAIVGYLPELRFLGRTKDTTPDKNKAYGVVLQNTVSGKQSGFGSAVRCYTTNGVLYIQIYSPTVGQNTYEIGRKLADMMKNAFRVRNVNNVWYREWRVQELGIENGFYRFNAVIDYTYDEQQ